MTPKELTQPAFHLITYYRIADGLADSESEAPEVVPALVRIDRKVFRPQSFTVTVAARIFRPDGKTLMFAQTLVHRASYGQARASLLAAAAQNLASAPGRHACSKAMRTVSLNSTRLIRPFHARFPQSLVPRETSPNGLTGVTFQCPIDMFLSGCRLRCEGKEIGLPDDAGLS
jgi:hypothetical protein